MYKQAALALSYLQQLYLQCLRSSDPTLFKVKAELLKAETRAFRLIKSRQSKLKP